MHRLPYMMVFPIPVMVVISFRGHDPRGLVSLKKGAEKARLHMGYGPVAG